MGDIKEIVDLLNRPAFGMNLSLVQFANKSPIELLQTVNDVFTVLDPKQKKNLRDEPPDEMAIRMMEFLLVLNYKHDMDLVQFKDRFIAGDKNVIYPLLMWILHRVPDLRKRAYLARFLRGVDVPEEYFADDIVVSLYQKYKELQGEFKEVHKAVDKARQGSLNPAELQSEISQLESERTQLNTKLGHLRKKNLASGEASSSNFEEVLERTHALRKEQDEDAQLFNQLQEQKQRLMHAESRFRSTANKLREMQDSDMARTDPHTLLDRLREEVKKNRHTCDATLDKEIKDRQHQLREFQHMMQAAPITEDEVDDLGREIQMLENEVDGLTQERDRLMASTDGKIGFYRDRANAMEKKRERLEEALEEVESDKRDAEADLRQLNTELRAFLVDGQKPKTEAEMKKYMKELTEKTNTYKEHKQELQELRAEVNVLVRTEEVLRSRDENLQEFNLQQEKAKGVEGYQETQENLEHVSAKKEQIDASKGQTLDEISSVVSRITLELKSRKTHLAPQIQQLRTVRSAFEELEADYLQKKAVYDNTKLGLDSERLRMEQALKDHQTGVAEEESSYHFLHCLQDITNTRVNQMRLEASYQSGQGQLNSDYKTYQELFEKSVKKEEALAKQLRIQQKHIKEHHDAHVGQRAEFQKVVNLLEGKLRVLRELKEKEEQSMRLGASDETYMGYGDDGGQVERMVIG